MKRAAVIKGLDALPEDSKNMVFHAGTTARDGAITATGGRVLNVTARGASLQEARDRAYTMVDAIDWPDGVPSGATLAGARSDTFKAGLSVKAFFFPRTAAPRRCVALRW